MDPRVEELLRLAQLRKLPEAAPTIRGEVERVARGLRGESRRNGRAVAAWTDLVPAALLARCRFDGVRGGTIFATVDSSSSLWELDRLLREGGEAKLRAATAGAVQKVKLRVGALESDASPLRNTDDRSAIGEPD